MSLFKSGGSMNINMSKKSEKICNQLRFYCNRLINTRYWNTFCKQDGVYQEDTTFNDMTYKDAIEIAYMRFFSPSSLYHHDSECPARSSLATTLAFLYSIDLGGHLVYIVPKLFVIKQHFEHQEVILALIQLEDIQIAVDPSQIFGPDIFHTLADVKEYHHKDTYTSDIHQYKKISSLLKKKMPV